MRAPLQKSSLVLVFALLLVNTSFAQPANDDNCLAANLTPSMDALFSATPGTTVGTSESVIKDCSDQQSIDVWYKFTATRTYHKIVLKNSTVIASLNIQFFASSSCTNLSSLGCINNNLSGDSVVYKAYNLVVGAIYYVKVFTPNSYPDRGTFDICVTSPAIPVARPGNDECLSAAILTPSPNAINNPISGTCVNASPSVRDCYERQSDDVWYKFQATATNHKIIVKGADFVTHNGIFEYYPDGCNTNPYYGQCVYNYNGDSLVYKMGRLTPGTWYYVKVATNAANDVDRLFTISITTPTVPVNDECAQAVLLPTYETFHPTAGTMVEATGYFYDYNCNGSTINDVWYKFVATAPVHRLVAQGAFFGQNGGNILFFSGDCNNLVQVGCSFNNDNNPDSTFYVADNLIPGQTYYFKVYVWQYVNDEYTFNVSVLGGTDPELGCTYTVPTAANATIVANSGNICDHDQTVTPEYDNNADGYTVIQPTVSGDWVKLAFTKFNTEQDHDYVTIYEGEGTGGSVLYSGSGLPSPLPSITAHGPLTIRFQSDGNGIVSSGFKAVITNITNPCTNATPILYVDSSRIVSGDGTSWNEAYKTLSEALYRANLCSGINEIRVSRGTYYPTNFDGTATTSRDSSFRILRNGIKIYGGFASGGGGSDLAYPSFNPTILNGDIGVIDNNTDNSYHVITVNPIAGAIDQSTVLDGFIVKNGNADGNDFNGIEGTGGAGLYLYGQVFECSPRINNCLFTNNSASYRGGALMINGIGQNSACKPVLRNCLFENNEAQNGGAISIGGYNSGGIANVNILDCVFKNNQATDRGGALFIDGNYGESSNIITNCTFSSNNSTNTGGAIHVDLTGSSNSIELWMNCVFTNNTASNFGGAISLTKTDQIKLINSTFNGNKTAGFSDNVIQFVGGSNAQPLRIKNCIFGNDLVEANGNKFLVTNSLINQVMPLGQNNITSGNPEFADALDPDGPDDIFNTKDDGLRITLLSPALNRGDNSVITIEQDTLDILQKNRKYGPAVDMGAFEIYDDPEYSGICPSPANHIMYVDGSVSASGNGSTWAQGKKTLSEALFIADQCTNVDSILIAEGTYYPVNYDGSFSDNRFNFFRIFRKNLKLYGGYPSGGGMRNIETHPTILSGDYNKNDNGFTNNEENSYHIMVIYPDSLASNAITPENTVIDGFTFIGGNPNRPFGDGVLNIIRGREIVYVVGGAIYNKSQYRSFAESSPLINNCTFINNSNAMFSTCGVGNTGPVITNSTFIKNRGANGSPGGGAILMDANESSYNNQLKLFNCVFEDNSAGSNLSLGGAILCTYKANVLADNTVFSKNEAKEGAAVAVVKSFTLPIPVFNNCLFNENQATISGSVFNGVKGNFNNCTFNNNTSTTTTNEIFGNPGTNQEAFKNINITNSIFIGDNIYENNIGGTVTSKYHLRNTFINQAAFNIVGNHNMIISDPHFIDAANVKGPDGKFGTADDGLRLSDISPAVNSGDFAGLGTGFPTTDIKNDPRVYNNGAIDMGCYEFQGAMNSNITLSSTYASVNRNVSNDPVVVINNDQLVAKLVNVNSNNAPFINQYKFAQVVHPVAGNQQPYLPNSFHISQENGNPALPPGNSLHVTVYFTQAMFNDYNNNNGIDDDMPTDAGDAAGISHIRIYQYHGTENAGCELQNIVPSCYNGPAEEILPISSIWNGGQQRWEVTFSVSTFSGFYISGRQNQILPLQLVRFNADKKGQAVQLSWSTMNELNTSHFELERSKNGLQFQKIAQVKAAGNQNIANDYIYLDPLPEKNLNYYRLKQIDKDGRFTYSPVRLINFDEYLVAVYPNPILKGGMLQINLQNVAARSFEILNTIGQAVYKKSGAFSGQVGIPISASFPAGEYILRLVFENSIETRKLIVQ